MVFEKWLKDLFCEFMIKKTCQTKFEKLKQNLQKPYEYNRFN